MPHHDDSTQPGKTPSLQAPWRQEYLDSLDAKNQTTPVASPDTSFFVAYWLAPDKDRENHVVLRTGVGLILLNMYPYANGHLLVALGEARPALLDYTPQQRAHLWMLVELAADLMQRTLQPQGINIGINQGRAAGAGVPGHLHAHLVPRWSGDVNFMQVVGSVRVIPGSLDAMWDRYASIVPSMRG